ncbi:hypothetical protein ACFYXQ_00215 [Nocardia jiangxiensis]|uniref:Uncharacterized protein n=1 Tax=Nocardia jiangxiensis TaxID=282685 RepID=A0ABW6RS19_9NOCA
MHPRPNTRADHRIPPRPRTSVHTLDEKWCAAAGITRSGALLLRPDQIVAWRTPTTPADPATAFDSALDRILAEPQ